MLNIDKDIEAPRRNKYPWDEMGIGDSFLITGLVHTSVHSQVCRRGRKDGHKYTVKKCEDGFRVWRIK